MQKKISTKSAALFPIALVFFELAVYFSVDMYLPALPMVKLWFDTTEKLTQVTLSAWLIGAGTFQLLLGPLSDRFGRRPVLIGGCVVFTVSTLICAVTSSLYLFIFMRLIQGCTICC